MVRVFHVLKLWFRSRTLHRFPCAIGVRIGFLITLCLELLLMSTVSWGHQSILLSTNSTISDFWPWGRLPTVSRGYFHFFSFIGISWLTRYPKLVKSFSHSSGCGLPSWVVSPSPELLVSALPSESLHMKSPLDLFLTWPSAFRSDRQKENHWNDYKRNSQCWTNEEDMIFSIRHVQNFLWLECLRVGFDANKFDLDLGVQIDSVKQPIKRNSVGSWHVSHRWTSSIDNLFDDSFVAFKDVQLRLALRRMCVCGDVVHMRQLINHLGFTFIWVWLGDLLLDGMVVRYSSMNVTLLSPHPMNQVREYHPTSILHPAIWFLIL